MTSGPAATVRPMATAGAIAIGIATGIIIALGIGMIAIALIVGADNPTYKIPRRRIAVRPLNRS